MAALKDEISPALIGTLGAQLADQWSGFDRDRFEALALDGLIDRQLKARVMRVAGALAATMPAKPALADRVLRQVLAAGGMQSWASLPVTEYVAATMLEHPDIALPLLAALTGRFSAEFAVRPFIETHPELTLTYLHRWVSDPDEHVRRLASEATRPRLPWAPQLRGFIADPTPTIALLDRLFDDDSVYVRRSVANHLNDISKDHPELAVDVARRWLTESTHGDYVGRHALRTLVKKGHPGALAALGFGAGDTTEVTSLTCTPDAIPIGGAVTIVFTVNASTPVRAAIDYRVHYQGANGPKAPKVFKLAVRDLAPGEPVTISRTLTFDHVSIRRIHPGPHQIDIQINGAIVAATTIDITP
ncbi:MAG: DNA alkylation repair protein [Acidimicrobiales bacterium]